MAHGIEIRDGQASMMYVGDVPWHGLGVRLDRPATAFEALRAARLDWVVDKKPLYASVRDDSRGVPRWFMIVRPDLVGSGSFPVLGIVGKGYRPLQNREAFEFLDPIVGEGAAAYHTAGALGNGERVWILAKLPVPMRVVGDDIAEKYLLLSNSHDGTSSVQIKFTPVRVVCQNTLTLALSDGRTLRVRHTRNLMRNLAAARYALGIIDAGFRGLEESFVAMTRVPMNPERLGDYLARVFPAPGSPADGKAARRVARDRAWSEYFFDQGKGADLPGVRGTLWAAYNGVTELVDHRQLDQPADRRLSSVWFGEGYRAKARAYRVAVEQMGVWRN
ncbi:DUF932 domain-containing protein [soil metagenome]